LVERSSVPDDPPVVAPRLRGSARTVARYSVGFVAAVVVLAVLDAVDVSSSWGRALAGVVLWPVTFLVVWTPVALLIDRVLERRAQ
jgi:hypothetical protein